MSLPRTLDLLRQVRPGVVPWVAMAAMLGAGCTTLQSAPLPPDALRSGIRAGELIEPGQDVWITTADGKEHAFKVSALDADRIAGEMLGGEAVDVAVDDVVELRTVELAVMPSVFAGLGIYYLAGMAVALAMVVDDL